MNKDSRFEVRIAGMGGQGIVLAAIIIGKAVIFHSDSLFVVQTQSYGPEARGGTSKAEVIIDKHTIDYPKTTKPNIQIILTQDAYDAYSGDTADDGLVIVDDFYVSKISKLNATTLMLPIIKTARSEVKTEAVANVVALGASAKILEKKNLLSIESLELAIKELVPRGTESLNLKAFLEGYRLA